MSLPGFTLSGRSVAIVALLTGCGGRSEPSDSELTLLALGPNAIRPVRGSLAFAAHGAGFVEGALVESDGAPLETVFDSDASWIDETSGDVVYSTCTSACTSEAGWTRTRVDHIAPTGFAFGWSYTSIAQGPNGLELSYHDATEFRLRGASCAADCTAVGAWTTFTVSLHGSTDFSDRITSLLVDGSGRRHVVWTDRSSGVRYTKY